MDAAGGRSRFRDLPSVRAQFGHNPTTAVLETRLSAALEGLKIPCCFVSSSRDRIPDPGPRVPAATVPLPNPNLRGRARGGDADGGGAADRAADLGEKGLL